MARKVELIWFSFWWLYNDFPFFEINIVATPSQFYPSKGKKNVTSHKNKPNHENPEPPLVRMSDQSTRLQPNLQEQFIDNTLNIRKADEYRNCT